MRSPDLDQAVPAELPLLTAAVEHWGRGEQPLAGVTAVLLQHQLGTMVPMVRALIALGLAPERTYFIDIPYTANATVRDALLGLGIPAGHFAPADYTLEKPYVPYQRRRVQDLIGRLRPRLAPSDRVLVLDDGAYFVEAMACYARPIGGLRVVEQTTRGFIKLELDPALEHYARTVPLVDVAHAPPKARWEGPEIGVSVCRALSAAIGDLLESPQDRCLLLGYGTIGHAVAQSLIEGLGVAPDRIHVFDPEPAAGERAAAAGHRLWRSRDAEPLRFKLVVGCSGRSSFTVGDRVFLEDGAVLASASSGAAELSREQFVELADSHDDDDIYVIDRETLASRSVHDPIDIHLVDRTVRFLNGGFPVNFDGRVNCVPAGKIQVTRALMLAAALQAVEAAEPGIVPLDPARCAWIDEAYAAL